jgi:hypothetical protein
MIKSVFAAAAALSMSAGAALAGPYVNVETNAGYTGSDYDSSVTDFHVGYEGPIGNSANYYIQGGPALVAVDGESNQGEYSGKAGAGIDLGEQLNVYGEVSFLTDNQTFDDDLGLGLKAGVKYTF